MSLRAVLADADVDAANLELVLQPHLLEQHEFMGGSKASLDSDKCEGCGVCAQVCRFDAIQVRDGQYSVDMVACDGCAACVYQCPTQAIHMEPQLAGHWFRSDSRYGPLFHAALRPAHENSGKLVTLVKQQARLLGLDQRIGWRAPNQAGDCGRSSGGRPSLVERRPKNPYKLNHYRLEAGRLKSRLEAA